MTLLGRSPLATALLVAVALMIPASSSARAQERTDYKDVYNNVLGAIGLGSDKEAIDYSPRAPIVVPPTNDLPPPADARGRSAGFPTDPDVIARRKALADPRRPVPSGESGGQRPRAYLVEPPAAYLDGAAVAATGNQVDRGDTPAAKRTRRHRAKPDPR